MQNFCGTKNELPDLIKDELAYNSFRKSTRPVAWSAHVNLYLFK